MYMKNILLVSALAFYPLLCSAANNEAPNLYNSSNKTTEQETDLVYSENITIPLPATPTSQLAHLIQLYQETIAPDRKDIQQATLKTEYRISHHDPEETEYPLVNIVSTLCVIKKQKQ